VENNTRAPTPGKRGTPRARPEPDSLGEGEQADTKPRDVLETSKPTAVVESSQLLSQA